MKLRRGDCEVTEAGTPRSVVLLGLEAAGDGEGAVEVKLRFCAAATDASISTADITHARFIHL